MYVSEILTKLKQMYEIDNIKNIILKFSEIISLNVTFKRLMHLIYVRIKISYVIVQEDTGESNAVFSSVLILT